MSDNINHPAHYTAGKVECIDALEAATEGLTGIEAVCTANAIKYLWRWSHKGGMEDLRKAQWYIDRLIEKHSDSPISHSPWILVSERKPAEEDETVLVCVQDIPRFCDPEPLPNAYRNLIVETAQYSKYSKQWYTPEGGIFEDENAPLFWMPLPDPPKEADWDANG